MTDQADTTRNPDRAALNLPVPRSPPSGGSRGRRPAADAGFASHALGGGEQRRGLRGGPPVLQAARRAYLDTQWSGQDDRRAAAGLLALTRL